MRRPNPWIAIPSLLFGAIAGVLGAVLTNVSCRVRSADGTVTTCPLLIAGVGVGTFLVITIGVAVVLVLVFRSLAEWKEGR